VLHHSLWSPVLMGGVCLIQGDPGDSVYIIISGRVRGIYSERNQPHRISVSEDLAQSEVYGNGRMCVP